MVARMPVQVQVNHRAVTSYPTRSDVMICDLSSRTDRTGKYYGFNANAKRCSADGDKQVKATSQSSVCETACGRSGNGSFAPELTRKTLVPKGRTAVLAAKPPFSQET
eukprot:2004331-Rhodomonas_salina.2